MNDKSEESKAILCQTIVKKDRMGSGIKKSAGTVAKRIERSIFVFFSLSLASFHLYNTEKGHKRKQENISIDMEKAQQRQEKKE